MATTIVEINQKVWVRPNWWYEPEIIAEDINMVKNCKADRGPITFLSIGLHNYFVAMTETLGVVQYVTMSDS